MSLQLQMNTCTLVHPWVAISCHVCWNCPLTHIGTTEFAERTWLGVQYKKPSKQNFFSVSLGVFLYGAKFRVFCMKLQGVKDFSL